MPLVSAKCTNCGANLTVDNTKDTAICEFCGSAFIVEKAINNYNITNHNTINADVVNIYNNNNNNIDLSISIEIQIENYLSLIEDAGYCSLLSPSDLIAMIDISTNNEQIANSKKLLDAVTNYCNKLDFKFDFNYLNPPIHYNLIFNIMIVSKNHDYIITQTHLLCH